MVHIALTIKSNVERTTFCDIINLKAIAIHIPAFVRSGEFPAGLKLSEIY